MSATLATSLLQTGDEHYTRLLIARANVGDALASFYTQTWLFGRILTELKERAVEKGQWYLFLDQRFPRLGDTEKTRQNRAADAMAFYRANEKLSPPESGGDFQIEDFDRDSIRTCIHHLAPDKERPLLKGDEEIQRAPTPVTFVNTLIEYFRKERAGLTTRPPLETLRKDFREPIKIIIELVGSDYVRELLEA